MTRAALGFRPHSGWVALVAVAGEAGSTALPTVIDRRRIEFADPGIPGSTQPYHAAQRLDLEQAEKLLCRCQERSSQLAQQALSAIMGQLREKGYEVAGCGLLLGSGRPMTTLAATLASHALIHTAEGELFRGALSQASEQCGLPVTGVRERELYALGSGELGIPIENLRRRVAELGRTLGPPWREDQKLAFVAACLALAAART